MFHRIAASMVIAFMTLGVPTVALAHGGGADRDDKGEKGGGRDHDGDDRRAPEPLTMLGLGLGAVGIVAGRWAYGRAKRKP
jgi:hypothetical protein